MQFPRLLSSDGVLCFGDKQRRCVMTEQEVGVVTHYFGHISVAAIRLTTGELSVGDTIHVKGHTADFTSKVDSMQIEHQTIQSAKPGDVIGVRVSGKAHEHDKVFKVIA
jgi:putative protease